MKFYRRLISCDPIVRLDAWLDFFNDWIPATAILIFLVGVVSAGVIKENSVLVPILSVCGFIFIPTVTFGWFIRRYLDVLARRADRTLYW